MNTNRSFVAGVAALALAHAGLSGGGAETVRAAGTAASAFELTLEAELTPPFFMTSEGGTFRSRAPFCASGTFVEDDVGNAWRWRFTCDDATGSLTVVLREDSTWRILDGSGNYAGLRGSGSLRGEQLCGENCDLERPIPWRGTLLGVVDRDAVAPTIAISSANAAKLRRPAGAYSIRLALGLRDDVEGNPVSYTLRVTTIHRGIELARKFGTTTNPTRPLTLRIRPPNPQTKAVRLQLAAEDPIGNASSLSRALKLPR
jgi:hypothetical protein